MNVRVLFFATMRERSGIKQADLEIPEGMLIADFKAFLIEQFPKLTQGLASAVIAVNREFAFDDQVIPAGAELAIFPPVSGG